VRYANPLPGATPAARQSRFRGKAGLAPRLAHFVSLRHPLPGATPVARQSRFHGVPDLGPCRFRRPCTAQSHL